MMERDVLALPVRLGGLSIVNLQTISNSEFAASKKVTSPFVTLILQQKLSFGFHVIDAHNLAKSKLKLFLQSVKQRRGLLLCVILYILI